MTYKFLPILLIVILSSLIPNAILAQEETPPSAGQPLCIPGSLNSNQDCLAMGPTAYLNRMAENGMILPLSPLPAHRPEISDFELPFYYGRVRDGEIGFYTSAADAAARTNAYRYLHDGFNFVTYIDAANIDGDWMYMIEPGIWVNGRDLSFGIAPSQFIGMEMNTTPANYFGWVIFLTETVVDPAADTPVRTGNLLNRYEIIQVYDSQEVRGITWHLIGPDEWVEARFTALVYPMTEAPEGITNGRWIEINLFEQTVAVYENNRMVYATLVSSGLPGFWTRPGLFQITEKVETTPMTGSFEANRSDFYYLEDVPWAMYFDESRAFHGAYWHDRFGYEQSHGCANLAPADSLWLFNWANIGDFVFVWDPSGQTPTDPSLYTAGGA